MDSTHRNIYLYDMVTTSYLFSLGFKIDTSAPEGVYRMKHNKMYDHHISITFDILPADKGYLTPSISYSISCSLVLLKKDLTPSVR